MPRPGHIVKVPLPDADGLDDDINAYFAKGDEKLGLVPNVVRAYTVNQE